MGKRKNTLKIARKTPLGEEKEMAELLLPSAFVLIKMLKM